MDCWTECTGWRSSDHCDHRIDWLPVHCQRSGDCRLLSRDLHCGIARTTLCGCRRGRGAKAWSRCQNRRVFAFLDTQTKPLCGFTRGHGAKLSCFCVFWTHKRNPSAGLRVVLGPKTSYCLGRCAALKIYSDGGWKVDFCRTDVARRGRPELPWLESFFVSGSAKGDPRPG